VGSVAMNLIYSSFFGIIAGIIIGLERQWQKKFADIRTIALVCMGASMFVTLSTFFVNDGSPTRIAAQVVSGIGFLAGGVIIRDGYSVTGLNTAATLWCAAAVGSIIGAGHYAEGLICAVLISVVNISLGSMSKKVDNLSIFQKSDVLNYSFSVVCREKNQVQVRMLVLGMLNQMQLNFNKILSDKISENEREILIQLEIYEHDKVKVRSLMENLLLEADVVDVQRKDSEIIKTKTELSDFKFLRSLSRKRNNLG
jgi:putative Mg2+ transporter-C (MgtC) family protein